LKLFTLREPVAYKFSKSVAEHIVPLEAGRRYVLNDSMFLKPQLKLPERCLRISTFQGRLKPFLARPSKGRRLLFYTGAGGYGDQVMAWPVVKIFAEMGYHTSVLVDPGNEHCWKNFPWVQTVHMLPTEEATFGLFDEHAIFEFATNQDQHEDQLHPVDNYLMRSGLDPNAFSAQQKVVRPIIPENEVQQVKERLGGRNLGMYQLASTSCNRNLSPEASGDALRALGRAFPSIYWLGVHDKHTPQEYQDAAKKAREGLPNVEPALFGNQRIFFAMVAQATIAVGPDSFLMHAAGSCEVPCVGLWGSTAPEQRSRYYKNHIALYPKSRCPASPCWWTVRAFPPHCPQTLEPRTVCAVLGSITTQDIITAVAKALNVRPV